MLKEAAEQGLVDEQTIHLTKARFFIQDAKTESGVRDVDIHGRLQSELQLYRTQLGSGEMDDPAFPSLTGSRRSKDNVRLRVVDPLSRAPTKSAQHGSSRRSTST